MVMVSSERQIRGYPQFGGYEIKDPLTTIAIAAHCNTEAIARNMLSTPAPDSLLCFPPLSITMYDIRAIPSITTAKDIKKPTVRHMEQKGRSLP